MMIKNFDRDMFRINLIVHGFKDNDDAEAVKAEAERITSEVEIEVQRAINATNFWMYISGFCLGFTDIYAVKENLELHERTRARLAEIGVEEDMYIFFISPEEL